jgi:hypothetical protein
LECVQNWQATANLKLGVGDPISFWALK